MKDGTLSKDQTVNALRNLGYDAENSSGVVVIYVDTEDYIKNNRYKHYKKVMENLGYIDPYFTVWSPSNTLTDSDLQHWSAKPNRIKGHVTVAS